MKACIIQPPYSRDTKYADEFFAYKLRMLDECEEDLDLIVLPEDSEVPCAISSREEFMYFHEKYIDTLFAKCAETAKRCQAVVFVNALDMVDGRYRNTTHAFDKTGKVVGKYFKTHIPPAEKKIQVAYDYTQQYNTPYVLELDGIRYAFLTCYDFYFYENFPQIARSNVDIIIGCSLQRSDTHEALEIMCRFLAYHTNAYVLRSSVSFDENSKICGASMAVAPDGTVLANLHGRFGRETVEFDPHQKYYKPAGFGRGLSAHYQYIEEGRNPWQYRPAGSAICLPDDAMPYPRVCAHRGFNTIAPENSMPAFGAAVASGAEEIEFDLWSTKDGELVSLHDPTLERTSNGTGNVWEHTYEELTQYDFGIKCREEYKGLKIVRFEEILQKFSCHVIMNIHVKIWDMEFENPMLEKIVALIRKYDCAKHVYFMTTSDKMLKAAKEYAPEIHTCVGHDGERPYAIVDRAIALKADKVQLFRPYFNKEMVEKAHENGILCNVFWADTEEDTRSYLEMGIDTILTNDYWRISQIVKEYRK